MRLASSVDLNEENEYAPKGSDLAKNLVLFGPNVKVTDTYSDPTAVDVVTGENTSDRIYTPYQPTQALTSFNGEYYNTPGSYGFGDISKYGFSGPPGIESIEVQALNRGAIRKANISIVAQNPAQFKLIEALYLRLGFSMLVEWGHTMYYDNDGNFITSPPFSNQAFDSFINGGQSFLSIARKIENVRKETDYNYDGFIGYVTNFDWSYRPNGTYSISLSLISRGGLIDSLTVNQPALLIDNKNPFRTFKVTKKEQRAINRLTEEELVTVDEKGNQFFEAVAISSTQDNTIEEEALENANVKPRDIIELFINLTRLHLKNRSESKTDSNAPKHYTLGQGKYLNTFALKFDTGGTTNESQENYYIELGRLLVFISNNCLLYAKEGTTDEDQIINIDYSYGKSYMLSHPLQTSADPGVCVFQTEITNKANDVVLKVPFPTKFQSNFKKSFYKADLMQIPINIEYIRSILINERDEDNKIDLFTFLTKILEGVRIATGLLNNFVVTYDENDNVVKIYDDNYIPRLEGERQAATINVNYLKDNEGTFVNSINLRSKIFPKLQNLVAIASQNPNGASVGENVASYQRLNQEYQDRIAKHTSTGYTANELETDEETNSFEDTFKQSYERLTDFIVNTYDGPQGKWKLPSSNLVDQTKKDLESILNYEIQKDVQDGKLPSPFFIPIELDISMKGLAGFKLYEKFDITPDDILPSNYPSNLNYIIQGVSHTIKNNTWETSLKTLSWIAGTGVPKNTTSSNPSKYVVGKTNYEAGESSATASDQYDGRTATGDPVTQNRIVLKLNRVLQNDIETLGILEVYESDETTLIERYVTVELPWKGNQNRVSCIPQGEYSFETRVHQKFGQCFFLTGNAKNNFNGGGLGQLPAPSTGYVRDSIFIHTAPQAIGWLEGCIGPGFKFNTKGNPTHSSPQTGIGSNYRDPAALESRQALTQIYNHVINSTGGFGRITIRNGYGMFGAPFTDFNDPQLQNLLIGLNLV